MKRWVERALNIYPGDLGRGAMLCACLFLVISSYVIGKVAGAALFLSRFQAKQLAYADISSSILVALVVAGYFMVARRIPLQHLLFGSMIFFASNCALFWALARYDSHLTWLFPVVYVWVKVFGVLAPTQIWTLANYVLTTREAKRVFGMVGSGAIVGWIFAGYFSKTIAKAFGTESLLLGMAVFLIICAGLIIYLWRSGQVASGGAHGVAETSSESGPRNLFASMKMVSSSSYLRAIAAVICISSLVTTLDRLAVSGNRAGGSGKERCAGGLFWRFQLLRRHTFTVVSVARHHQIPAKVWHRYVVIRASDYGIAGFDRPAGIWHAGCRASR